MGAWGAIIMAFFGAVFATMTLVLALDCAAPVAYLPFAIFAAIALAAVVTLRAPGTGHVVTPREDRIITWSTVGEGLGLFVAANLVVNLGRRDLLLPAMALVVGLHFVPMGFAIPFRPFQALAAALLVAAAAGFAVAAPLGGAIAGFAAAAALWTAAALAVRRDRLAKAA